MRTSPVAAERYGLAPSLFVIAALTASIVGCGGKPATVYGVVTVDGALLNSGTVSFSPVSGGKMAVGRIQDDGSYQVMTNRDRGLEIGEYAVTIVSREIVPQKNGAPPLHGEYYAPKKYSSTKTSELKFMVESGSNEFDLALTSE